MKEIEDIVSFLDVLDFDEEVVDRRLSSLMEKKSLTVQNLSNIISLLNYKHLLNIKESDECDNDREFEFVGKLIKNIDETNIAVTCKILSITLSLNPSSVTNKAEHLLQQLLCNICDQLEDISSEESPISILLCLKLCDSILDAVTNNGEKLSLPFLDVPLEKILLCPNEKLKTHFLTVTVKRFFEAVEGYHILDRIWNCITCLEGSRVVSLKALCILSNYFLPLPQGKSVMLYKSNVVTQSEFWELTLYGLSSGDASTRKLATYLLKRSIDCLKIGKSNIEISTTSVTMSWSVNKENVLKTMWDNFFILMDSLEEKQSNIVLPSLQLFDLIKDIGQCWLNCAYNVGLQHDNLQVKLQCAMYRLQTPIFNDKEALVLLESLNDMNIYDRETQHDLLKLKLKDCLCDQGSFVNIIGNIPKIKWSPVPIYHLTTALSCINNVNIEDEIEKQELARMLSDLSKVPCNNIIIRKAFHRNLSHVIGNCCYDFDWKTLLNLYNLLEVDLWRDEDENPLISLIKYRLNIPDKTYFFKDIAKSHLNIDFMLLYLSGHEDDVSIFIQLLNDMFEEISMQQFNDHSNNSLNNLIFVIHLIKQMKTTQPCYLPIISVLEKNYGTLLNYIFIILKSDIEDVESVILFLDSIQYVNKLDSDKATITKFYNEALSTLKADMNIYKNIYSIYIMNSFSNFDKSYGIDVDDFISILNKIDMHYNCKQEGYGRLRNIFMSKACELIHVLLKNNQEHKNHKLKDLIEYVLVALECGGYSCLKWILNIIDILLPKILEDSKIQFDVTNFLQRAWNEIEAIKTNKLYTDCIEAFVNILLNEALLKRPLYNNIVISYCNRIVEYATIKNTALYYLVDAIENKDVLKYSHIVYVFSDILLASAVPRKDQRITENVIVNLSRTCDFSNVKACLYTNFHIKYKSLLVLSKIDNAEILETIVALVIRKIDELFKNKQRYHSNSTLHRTVQIGLQHIMYILLKHRSNYVENVAKWCIEFLGKLPHQTSIRLYLEWYISLYYYYKTQPITEKILLTLKVNNVPIISQFMILYWLLTHKLKTTSSSQSEYEFVMDTIMEHTMGPTYSIRMYAQYLAKKIYEISSQKMSKYEQTIKIIDRTLVEAAKLKEKSFDKLVNDILVHKFDIVEYLTPSAIYNGVFLHEERENEAINEVFALSVYEEMVKVTANDGFFEEWKRTCQDQDDIMKLTNTFVRNVEAVISVKDSAVGTIQKKYIPWKNMSDIDVLDMKESESKSELIVVASLIDKLPNLGGMARTSEVFGVNTYVIDSVRHLQDKQFQGLSVSAERWVNVIEIRPGQPLKDYLMSKKSEGYSIVAAEQTSSSISLKAFKFPKKTLLLLGHEKEGVPCDLLPFMDACVEIPQQGVVRSLNVHVTAAIFIWEYTRQIIL